MGSKSAVENCAACPLCKFTRSRKKESVFYIIARNVQGTCPICKEANKATGKNLQKSNFFVGKVI